MKNETCYEKLIGSVDAKRNVMVFENHVMRMRTVLKSIDAFAASLVDLGFEKGDVLTIYLPTTPQAVVAFYACSKIGVIANFVHPLVPVEQLRENLATTKSKGLMYYDYLVKNGRDFADFNQILIKCSVGDCFIFRKPFYSGYAALINKGAKECLKYDKLIKTHREIDVAATGDDTVCYMHSGGTSGTPKIVMLSNAALNAVADALDTFTTVDTGKEYALVALPVFHAYGLGVSIHTCMIKRYNLVLMPKFNPKRANRFIKRFNVTMFAGVPIMFKKMSECGNFRGRHLRKLKVLWCGGDAAAPTLIDRVNYILSASGSTARLMPGYGLTEVSGVCAANTNEFYNKKSCGKPIPGTTIEIWNSHNLPLQANCVGEVAVSSDSIMRGYLTEDNCIVEKDGIKWVKTGDIGYLNDEGYLFIVDRKKRSVKINAINVFPAEIEALVRNKEFVDEACAVPYRIDNKTFIKLYVKLTGAVSEDRARREILAYCTQNLIKYAVPKKVVFIKEMPLTKMGKIDYNKFDML